MALVPAGFSESFLDLSAAVVIIDRARRLNRKQCIWQPCLHVALLSFFVSSKQKTEFRKPTTSYCFPCESEFTSAGNFQTEDSDFALAIVTQRIPISGWFCNSTVKIFL